MESSIVCGDTQVHRICVILEYILSISVLEYYQADSSYDTNQLLAHAIHWLRISIPASTNKNDIYVKPPKVSKEFEKPDLPNITNRFIYVYKLIKKLYGLKDAEMTWYDYFKHSLPF